MGLHKGMDKYIGVPSVAPRGPESWQLAWPNTADHNFNYYKLLNRAEQSAIAQNQKRPTKAMPLLLTNPEEGDTWLAGSAEEASGEGREEAGFNWDIPTA